MTRRGMIPALLLALAAVALPAGAATGGAGGGTQKGAASTSTLIRAAAEVLAIDMPSRTLTLRREDGNTLTVVADRRVGNLAQVSVGDIVIAQYGHARAISLKRLAPGETSTPPPPPAPATAPKSPPRRTLIADIIAIDDRTGQATLKGVNGGVVDVVFRNRKVLAKVRIGDRVRLEYTDAVAIAIKPAGQAVTPRRPTAP